MNGQRVQPATLLDGHFPPSLGATLQDRPSICRIDLWKELVMCRLKLIAIVACLCLLLVESASAQPGWRYRNRYCCGYVPPVYVYPPVVVPPPPVAVGPVYTYPAPAYLPPPVPMYGPTVYGYQVIGPWGRRRIVFNSPGFGVYIRP